MAIQKSKAIIVTGGAGFIGSAMVWKLNQIGFDRIIVVDTLEESEKWKNLRQLRFDDFIHKDKLWEKLDQRSFAASVQAVIHMGACSATTERNADYLYENNFRYSQRLGQWSLTQRKRFVYASSGATYGDGSRGFSDNDKISPTLLPLNMYGYSKQLFDLWVLRQNLQKNMAGIKFFNVYGPNEYHKEDMMSVVCKAYNQIKRTGTLKLFKSYKTEYVDGDQKRDFVYVKDAVAAMAWLLEHPKVNGIFNLGTGKARTWNDLAKATFDAMNQALNIQYIPMPEDIRDRYQYFTQAETDKLRRAGYKAAFTPLEDGVHDYVKNYLSKEDNPYL